MSERCRSCGDSINPAAFEHARRMGRIPQSAHDGHKDGYCLDCFTEIRCGACPVVTDSALPAPGTGLVPRQRFGMRHTDS